MHVGMVATQVLFKVQDRDFMACCDMDVVCVFKLLLWRDKLSMVIEDVWKRVLDSFISLWQGQCY